VSTYFKVHRGTMYDKSANSIRHCAVVFVKQLLAGVSAAVIILAVITFHKVVEIYEEVYASRVLF